MLIIASVDVSYRGTYIIHADSWRSSVLCQFAGILAMLSSEVINPSLITFQQQEILSKLQTHD